MTGSNLKIILFLLIITHSSFRLVGNNVYIYKVLYFENACAKCNSPLSSIIKLSKNNKIDILIEKQYETNNDVFLADLIGVNNINIVYNDSSFEYYKQKLKLTINKSVLFVENNINKQIEKVFFLDELRLNLNQIYCYNGFAMRKTNVDKNFNFSNSSQVNLSWNKDYYFLNDQQHNKIKLLNRKNLETYFKIKNDSIDFWYNYISKVEPYAFKKIKSMDTLNIKIKNFLGPIFSTFGNYTINDTTYFILEFNYLTDKVKNKKNDLEITNDLFVCAFYDSTIIKIYKLDKINNKNFALNYRSNFLRFNNKYYFTLYLSSKKFNKIKIIAEYELAGDNIKFKKLLNYELPSFFAKLNGEESILNNYRVSNNLVFYDFYNEIYSIANDKIIQLDFEPAKIDYSNYTNNKLPDVWQYDLIEKEGVYRSFQRNGQFYFIMNFDRTGKLINKYKIDNINNLNSSIVFFEDFDTLKVFDKKDKVVYTIYSL